MIIWSVHFRCCAMRIRSIPFQCCDNQITVLPLLHVTCQRITLALLCAAALYFAIPLLNNAPILLPFLSFSILCYSVAARSLR